MNRISRTLLGLAGVTFVAFGLAGCGTTIGGIRPGGFSTVVIDAGHGGRDSGESPSQLLREKEVALDTARRLQPLLAESGLRTVMTRSSDVFVELDDRVAIANRYYPNAVLVSIHYNASRNSGPRGVETFFWRPDSYGLATRVQRHLIGETGLANRGVTRRVLRLTHNPRVPSILCECGFLTNRAEAGLISTAAYRQRVAQGIADGILEEQENGDANIGSLPPLERPVVSRPAYRHHTGRSHKRKMEQIRSRAKAKAKAKSAKSVRAKKKKRRS